MLGHDSISVLIGSNLALSIRSKWNQSTNRVELPRLNAFSVHLAPTAAKHTGQITFNGKLLSMFTFPPVPEDQNSENNNQD
jgi:hypothetical protein